jgi:hypothetical protein
MRNDTATAASGALITDIRSDVTELMNCKQGAVLNPATLVCLKAPNTLMEHLGLAQVAEESEKGVDSPQSGSSGFLATSATSNKCQRLLVDGNLLDEKCSTPIKASLGQPFACGFALLDGFGNPLMADLQDASMLMVVSIVCWDQLHIACMTHTDNRIGVASGVTIAIVREVECASHLPKNIAAILHG